MESEAEAQTLRSRLEEAEAGRAALEEQLASAATAHAKATTELGTEKQQAALLQETLALELKRERQLIHKQREHFTAEAAAAEKAREDITREQSNQIASLEERLRGHEVELRATQAAAETSARALDSLRATNAGSHVLIQQLRSAVLDADQRAGRQRQQAQLESERRHLELLALENERAQIGECVPVRLCLHMHPCFYG